MSADPDMLLRSLFTAAVLAADPFEAVPPNLPPRPGGRTVVVGAGKAAARMAEAVEQAWGPCEGLVITRYGHARPCRDIEVVEAAHPVPDGAGVAATARLLALLDGLGQNYLALVLISGGGSALLSAPADGVTLAEKQELTSALLASGAPIDEINVVRKHLSLVKGGQLALRAAPASVWTLMISDVPGDDPAAIASGPTVGEDSGPEDARAILARYDIVLPDAVGRALAGPSRLPRRDDQRLARVCNRVIAAPAQSLAAAAALAEQEGLEPVLLGDALEGEAENLARRQAALALEMQNTMRSGDRPLLLLSGGECTVTNRCGAGGSGGPNAEFALTLALVLDGAPGIHAIACDTDGIDGAAEVAGAVIGPQTLSRAAAAGLDPQAALKRHDSHSFFAALGDQVVPGPTLTNVNDFRAILVSPPGASGGAGYPRASAGE